VGVLTEDASLTASDVPIEHYIPANGAAFRNPT
jgi:hypothetical protein